MSRNCFSLTAIQFKHLHVMNLPAINMKAQSGTYGVPTLVSTGPGIDIQHVFLAIIHYLEDVGMTAHKDVGPVLPDQIRRLGIIMPRRAADVRHQDPESLALPEPVGRVIVNEPPVVAIAKHANERLERRKLRRCLESPAEIAGMPDHVDILEELPEFRRKHPVTV